MQRLVLSTAVLIALFMPANARGALFFLLDQSAAQPNERVTVRTGTTPKRFELRQRARPLQQPVRLYLVATDAAAEVHSRFDKRLYFVGSLVPDKNGRGLLSFNMPPLDAQTYTLAYWCPACAAFSRGRTFFVQRPDQFAPRYRSQTRLRLDATDACPVTFPNGNRPPGQPRNVTWYGNGLLWAGVEQDGIHTVPSSQVAADGSIGNKLLWVTTPPFEKPTVSGERLDAPARPLRVLGVNTGSFSGAANPSHMTPVEFATAGCWRLRARLGDVSLVYVVQLVVD
jgi:hypothetical protein